MLDKLIKILFLLQGKGYGSTSLKNEVKATKKFVKGGVFFDVGANKGLYTKEILTQYAHTTTEIHLFEPSKELTAKYLNFADNRVRVNNFALSNSTGTGLLYKVPGNSGLNSLTKRRLDHFDVTMDEVEEINTITLDDYTEKYNIKFIDLIKIDVEGHELDVLKGADRNLKENRIRCIQFEFGGCNIDTKIFFQNFWYLLNNQYNFQIFRIAPFGIKQIKKYTELDEIFLTTNFLAIKQFDNL
jgi:FkbM family methyltransferase